MADPRPTISTHVLDSALGSPAPGIRVRLLRLLDDGSELPAGEGTTDGDGRVRNLLAAELVAADYRLVFDLASRQPDFFLGLAVVLRVEDTTRSYHVPLIVAPYALSTYRGS
jgi:5-hydroxyisourate hydrolase